MAKTTAMPSGPKRYRAGPCRKKTETKTLQIARVETRVGRAISAEP